MTSTGPVRGQITPMVMGSLPAAELSFLLLPPPPPHAARSEMTRAAASTPTDERNLVVRRTIVVPLSLRMSVAERPEPEVVLDLAPQAGEAPPPGPPEGGEVGGREKEAELG